MKAAKTARNSAQELKIQHMLCHRDCLLQWYPLYGTALKTSTLLNQPK